MAASSETVGEVIDGKLLLEITSETTSILSEKQEQLRQCKWTDGESNTDTDFSNLACKCAEDAWHIIKSKSQYAHLNGIEMTASIPDIICTFSKNGTPIKISKNKIELKSSKSHIMPGSTIGKLNINQPLIYCLRPENSDNLYKIRYGQYHNAIGESDTDLFQDRSPRPKLNFTKLSSQPVIIYCEKKKDDWIIHYAKCAVNRLKTTTKSWQDRLIRLILYYALEPIHTIEELNALRDSVRPDFL